jgi:hypothetical protein
MVIAKLIKAADCTQGIILFVLLSYLKNLMVPKIQDDLKNRSPGPSVICIFRKQFIIVINNLLCQILLNLMII